MECSKRVGWKEINAIEYVAERQECCIVASQKQGNNDVLKIFPLSRSESVEGKTIVLDIFGEQVMSKIRKLSHVEDLVIFHSVPDGSISVSVQKILLSVFGSHVDTHLRTRNYREDSKLFLPALKNVKVNKICTLGMIEVEHFVEAKRLENYFTASSNHEIVDFFTGVKGQFETNSGFFNSQHLNILRSELLAKDVLHNFRGKCAFMYNAFLFDFSVIQFLKRWISNEEFQKLEVIDIRVWNLHGFTLNRTQIMKSVPFKHFDSSKGYPQFEYTERMEANSFQHQFSSPHYIVRDYDGVVASVLIKGDRFLFGVWNKTENELNEQ